MSSAQSIQLLVTLIGIVIAILMFLFGPFSLLGNSVAAVVIFILAGVVAGFVYAKLAAKHKG